jgi:hypothetical protein
MRKKELSVKDIVAFQPALGAGPFKAEVVEITSAFKGIKLKVNYTETLYNPRPNNIWEELWTSGQHIVDLWNNFVRLQEYKKEQLRNNINKTKNIVGRSKRIEQELKNRGLQYTAHLSCFTLPVDTLEKLLGIDN